MSSKMPPDPSIFAEKHPLQNSWTLWYDNSNRARSTESWSLNLRRITDFSTVEDFWVLWKNIVPASRLTQGSSYYLFKQGVQPMWEDPTNEKGGKWLISTGRNQRELVLDQFFFHTALALIGETMDDDGQVTGLVVSVRRAGDKLAVWTQYSDKQHEDTIRRIGARIKSVCDYEGQIRFQAHEDYHSNKNNVRFEQ
eukprot:comp14035_c0_seq1/m.9881 comp14035_c0_seq1/g.9881  ORF comp14035_c0_seq1/g.9881 comp14035_c0_seq1/m.9881 type:complete len:196 (-) comp14035_c0_seq1:194-781(-)